MGPDRGTYTKNTEIQVGQTNKAKVPEEVSYVDMMGAVRNQGTTQMCVAFSITAILQYFLKKRAVSQSMTLSPSYMYGFRANCPRPGINGRDISNIMKKWGYVQESEHPFWKSSQKACGISDVGEEVVKKSVRIPHAYTN